MSYTGTQMDEQQLEEKIARFSAIEVCTGMQ